MNTEITDNVAAAAMGWIYFDAECRFCVAHRHRWGGIFERRGFVWLPLQTPGAAERLGITEAQLHAEMWLQLADGRKYSGLNAWSAQMRRIWWLWPLGVLLVLPGINALARKGYAWIAAHRHCLGGACRIPRRKSGHSTKPQEHRMTAHQTTLANPNRWLWLPFAVASGVALILARSLQPWVFMWVLAFAIYGGCKWLTYCEAQACGITAPALTRAIYLLCWPGMSLREFVEARSNEEPQIALRRWLAPTFKTLAGAGLVWLAVPAIPNEHGLARGWVGMLGIIMMLHFGTFQLLALALQAAGFNARPNMQAPLQAKSLADFWGNRWNTAFNVLADRFGFRLLTPRIGPRAALAAVFLASGLLHELVITLPARGGYGLPTAYFALQAIGIFVERLPWFRHWPWHRRLLAWVVLVAPLGCLFPPVFVRNVILPMLNAIGATGTTQ